MPAAAEYTANIQTQGPSPSLKNNLLLLHAAQLKDVASRKPSPLSCYWFIEFSREEIDVEAAAVLHTGLIMPYGCKYRSLLEISLIIMYKNTRVFLFGPPQTLYLSSSPH